MSIVSESRYHLVKKQKVKVKRRKRSKTVVKNYRKNTSKKKTRKTGKKKRSIKYRLGSKNKNKYRNKGRRRILNKQRRVRKEINKIRKEGIRQLIKIASSLAIEPYAKVITAKDAFIATIKIVTPDVYFESGMLKKLDKI